MSAFTATIPSTGEVLEFGADTATELLKSYAVLNEYAKALEGIKKQLQEAAVAFIDQHGPIENETHSIRVSTVQRYTYDKAVLREVLDEDTLDLFLEPAKTKVDKYLKENLDVLGESSTRIRESMIPSGKPYTVVKLEKLTRG